MIGCLKFKSGAQLRVVPANAGTHNHRRQPLRESRRTASLKIGDTAVPAFAGTTLRHCAFSRDPLVRSDARKELISLNSVELASPSTVPASVDRTLGGVRQRPPLCIAPQIARSDSAEPSSCPAIDRIAGRAKEVVMNGLIYLVGLIVVIMFILSFFGLR
jgi:hypothetical protein